MSWYWETSEIVLTSNNLSKNINKFQAKIGLNKS